MLSTGRCIDDILVLLSTADKGIDDILVLLSIADKGIDDTLVLLLTADKGIHDILQPDKISCKKIWKITPSKCHIF